MLEMEYLYAQSGIVLAEKEEEVNEIIDKRIVGDDGSVILEEEMEDLLGSIIARDHEETQSGEVSIEVCLKEFKFHYSNFVPFPCNFQQCFLHLCTGRAGRTGGSGGS